jgi:hypothetical protein
MLELSYGELDGPSAREVRAHLEGCAACRAEWERMEATRAAMRRLGPEPAPPGEGVLLAAARQAAGARAPRPLLPWLRLAAGAAAVVAVGGVSLRLLSERPAREAEAPLASPPAAGAPAPAAPPPAPPAARPERERLAARPEPRARPAPKAVAAPDRLAEAKARRSAEPFGGAREEVRRPGAAPPAVRPEASSAVEPAGAAPLADRGPAPAAQRRGAARSPAAGEAHAEAAAPAPAAAFAEALVAELQRRRDEGRLDEARRRLDPCPGGDAARLAWLDGLGRARRLARTRPAPGGEVTVDHWYDDAGRLRLVRVDGVGPEGRFARRIVLDEAGRRVLEDPAGPPWPEADLVRRDPAAAFWAPRRCEQP